MSRIFITGGAGYLGRAILRRAAAGLDWQVTVYSRDEEKQDLCRRRYPEARYVLGDVRDVERLALAMVGHDAVIHGAAMKYVDVSETSAVECFSVNIGGAQAVINAARQAGIRRVVGISTDKACVDYFAQVELAEENRKATFGHPYRKGKRECIASLVKRQANVEVLSLSEAGPVSRKITGWYKNKRANREMFHISYKYAYMHRGQNCGVWVTWDHLIFTTSGWKQAVDLTGNDLLVTGELGPNVLQSSLFVGTLLGDASIGSVGHSEKQLEWLKLKKDALGTLVGEIRKESSSKKQKSAFYVFPFRNGSWRRKFRKLFYPDGKKIVPRDLVEQSFNPIMLAAWFMNDGMGGKDKRGKNRYWGAAIATCGFTLEDICWLADFLTSKGLLCKPRPLRIKGKVYYNLEFNKEGSYRLFETIGKYVPPSLRYKLPSWAPPYDEKVWDLGKEIPFVASAIVKQGNRSPKDVYCIDVEDTHNFIVNGVVLHNCQPVNSYGASKMVMERLFAESSTPDTQFNCVRYGNVIGSTGSVVPLFKYQYESSGKVRVTDPNMTRFWMGADEAIDLIRSALEEDMPPGAIVLPFVKAMKMADVVLATVGEVPVEIIGVRPGEKLHERLLHFEESVRVVWRPNDYLLMPPGQAPENSQDPFTLSSQNPHYWLQPEEMRALIEDAETI